MSCFVVNDYHVSALVAWALRRELLPFGVSPDALAHELASANRAAYSERYAGRYDSELAPYGGLDRSAGADLEPVAIVKACDCLAYQACDWSAWDESEAAAHLAAIRAAALAMVNGGRYLPDVGGRDLPGYDAAAWELVEPEPAEPEPAAILDRESLEFLQVMRELAATREQLAALAARAADLVAALDRELPASARHHAAGERFNVRAALAALAAGGAA